MAKAAEETREEVEEVTMEEAIMGAELTTVEEGITIMVDIIMGV